MPYRTKLVLAEVRRRGASVVKDGRHRKVVRDGQLRPYPISHSETQMPNKHIKGLCKWAGWDYKGFILSISGSKKGTK